MNETFFHYYQHYISNICLLYFKNILVKPNEFILYTYSDVFVYLISISISVGVDDAVYYQ